MKKSPIVPVLSLAVLTAALVVLSGCARGGAQPGGSMPKPEVAVGTATSAPLPLQLTYTARAVGSREVEVRARISGILEARRFVEGSAVKAGDVLFQIDPEPYRAAVAQARGELGVERASLDEATRNRDRIVPLYDKNAVSQRQRDEAVSAYEVAAARVASAEARLKSAELDLGYTSVRAPISGLTSREVRSEGSLVQAGGESSLLTRIVQTDPLYIEFSVPEEEAALLRARLADQATRKNVQATLLLGNGEHPDKAPVTFIDNTVESTSGTVVARAVLPNKQGALLPGQFVRVRIEGVAIENVVAIPRKAVMMSPQGAFVWVIDANESASFRPVQMGRGADEQVVITQGLADGERYIVEGVMKVAPGAPVTAVPAEPVAREAAAKPTQKPAKDPA
ncbi:MAG: efflux RND transporter periplasmic adaptor subunit [Steroidobacteraceae bacterium]